MSAMTDDGLFPTCGSLSPTRCLGTRTGLALRCSCELDRGHPGRCRCPVCDGTWERAPDVTHPPGQPAPPAERTVSDVAFRCFLETSAGRLFLAEAERQALRAMAADSIFSPRSFIGAYRFDRGVQLNDHYSAPLGRLLVTTHPALGVHTIELRRRKAPT